MLGKYYAHVLYRIKGNQISDMVQKEKQGKRTGNIKKVLK